MKKKGFVIGGLIILAGAAGAGGWYYYKENYGDSAAASGEVAYVTKISTLLGEDSGVLNRFAGVVEPQETVKVNIENNRTVTEVKVKVGDEVKKGQLLFEYDLSSIQDSLKEAQLALDRLKNEALSLNTQISTLEKEKKKANKNNQLSYTIEIETNKMNLKKNEYDQVSKQRLISCRQLPPIQKYEAKSTESSRKLIPVSWEAMMEILWMTAWELIPEVILLIILLLPFSVQVLTVLRGR